MNDPVRRCPWWLVGLLCVALLGAMAAAALGWREVARLREETALAQETAARLEQERQQDRARLDKAQAAEDELVRLRKQTEEIHRLRAQYQELQRLKQEHARLEQENLQLRASQLQLSQSLRDASAARPPPIAPPPAAWIGVVMQPNPAGGVTVQDVAPNSPAATAGLVAGDVITAVDGRPITSAQQLREEIARKQVGQTVTVDALRNNTPFRVALVTTPFPR